MILLGLGANIPSPVGPPAVTLKAALNAIAARRIRIGLVSHLYRTPAWPNPLDPEFVNQVATLDTRLNPAELLAVLHDVEMSFGRKRSEKNAPRTLDLDLLDYDGRIEKGPPELPHPRMAERSFVLVPLRDIAPDWCHPETGKTLKTLIDALGPVALDPQRAG